MKNTIILALATAFCVAMAGSAFAGEIENFSSGAEKAFAQPVLAVTAAVLPEASPARETLAAPAGSAEYKKLAADFAKGTAPSKEDLAGWKAGRYLDRDFPITRARCFSPPAKCRRPPRPPRPTG